MRVAKWGNSLAIRIPASVAEVMELEEGDDVAVVVHTPREIALEKTPDREALLQRLRQYRGMIPKDFQFDRLEANARD